MPSITATIRRSTLAATLSAVAVAGTAVGIDSPAQLLNAPVPSACQHPAGTLVGGALPNIPEGQG